ncbi:MAG: aspartate kinase [Planctomycetota bacterium]
MFEKVLKFGGAALTDGPGVQRACRIVRQYGGARPIVVVSAHQGVTDLLDTVARSAAEGHLEGDRVRIRHRSILRQLGLDSELLDRHFNELFGLLAQIQRSARLSPAERDLVLSFGERMSARVVAHALRAEGLPATPVDAFDLGLTSDSNHGDARPLPESRSTVQATLSAVPGIPVVTGFLAKDKHGNLTTLGRNGSDLTAALVAEAVDASEVQLWKGVDGMMSADPEIVADARSIERLGFQQAAEYAFHGAEVLHAAALAPAMRANLAVRLLNVNDPEAPGTLLEAHTPAEGPIGIAARRNVVRIDLDLTWADPRAPLVSELFATLARHAVEPGIVRASAERLSVLVAPGNGLEAALAELGRRVTVERSLALVAVIGCSAGRDAAAAQQVLSVLAEARTPVVDAFVGIRQNSQVVLVARDALEKTVRVLHAGLLRPQTVRV